MATALDPVPRGSTDRLTLTYSTTATHRSIGTHEFDVPTPSLREDIMALTPSGAEIFLFTCINVIDIQYVFD